MKINLNDKCSKCFVLEFSKLGEFKEIKVVQNESFGLKYKMYITFHNTPELATDKILYLPSYNEFSKFSPENIGRFKYYNYLKSCIFNRLNYRTEYLQKVLDWIITNEWNSGGMKMGVNK